MATERTFAMIKPDAIQRSLHGKIIDRILSSGFKIVAMRLTHLTKSQAEGFYIEHKERPFFASLTGYMTSGPAILLALEADGAIKKWRDVMGATDPAQAAPGTIRKDFGESKERNSTHGSDSPESAAREIAYFFAKIDQL